MGLIDTLITDQATRVNNYKSIWVATSETLQAFLGDMPTTAISLPSFSSTIATMPTYSAPTRAIHDYPSYVDPSLTLPTAATLTATPSISVPTARTVPSVTTGDLFAQAAPALETITFEGGYPDLHIDELYAEMSAVDIPDFIDFDFPMLERREVRATPTITMPSFNPLSKPDDLPDEFQYANEFKATYQQMLPEMQAWVDEKTGQFIATYAPDYQSVNNKLSSRISAILDGETLPAQYENAMFIRARGRSEREYVSNEKELLGNFKRFGLVEPPGAVMAGLHQTRLDKSIALSNQSTDIYIKKTDVEISLLQSVLGQAAGYAESIRNSAIQYLSSAGNLLQQSANFADVSSNKLAKQYEHLIARSEFRIKLMAAINEQFELQQKSALAEMTLYLQELEAEKAKDDIDLKVIKSIQSRYGLQETRLKRAKTMIEIIKDKSLLDEIRLKDFDAKISLMRSKAEAVKLGFEQYSAYLAGDSKKLDGRMAALEVVDKQIKADTANVDAQGKAVEAISAANKSKIDNYLAQGDIYKLAYKNALDRFVAEAEVKKLDDAVYGQELSNSISVHQSGVKEVEVKAGILTQQYKSTVDALLESNRALLKYYELAEHGHVAVMQAAGQLAASAGSSMNSVVTSSLEAVA